MFARASRNLLLLLVSCPFTSRLPFHSFLSPSRGKLKLISSRRLTSHANVFLEYFPHRWPLEFNFRPNFSAEFLEGNSSNSFPPIFPPSFKRDERPREGGMRGEKSRCFLNKDSRTAANAISAGWTFTSGHRENFSSFLRRNSRRREKEKKATTTGYEEALSSSSLSSVEGSSVASI